MLGLQTLLGFTIFCAGLAAAMTSLIIEILKMDNTDPRSLNELAKPLLFTSQYFVYKGVLLGFTLNEHLFLEALLPCPTLLLTLIAIARKTT